MVNLETTILLTSYDYEGVQRSDGGDPVHVSVLPLHERQNDLSPEPLPATVTDLEDGTYHIKFRPPKEG